MDDIGYGQINTFDMSVNSVMLDLIYDYYYNNASLEAFMQNDYLIVKAIRNDDNILIIDLETYIMRDINTVSNYYGAYCFHDQLTESINNLGEDLVNGLKYLNVEKVLTFTFGTLSIVGGFAIVTAAVVAAPETGGISLGALFWGWSGIIGGATAIGYTWDDPWFTDHPNF